VTLLNLFLDDYFKVTLRTIHICQSLGTKRVFLKYEILMFCFKRVNAQSRLVHEHAIKAYMTGSKPHSFVHYSNIWS
jgi:hypothetical protein